MGLGLGVVTDAAVGGLFAQGGAVLSRRLFGTRVERCEAVRGGEPVKGSVESVQWCCAGAGVETCAQVGVVRVCLCVQ